MGNSRHIFKFACSEELPFSGNSGNPKIKGVKKVKLVSEDNSKEIEFQGSYFGSYYIFKPDGESNEKFQLFVHRTRDNDIGEEVYLSDPIDLKSIRAKVTLDNQCKYQVALSLGDNEWITLPRSSLSYTNYNNLKTYYNKDLSLSKSDKLNYVMHGQDKVCELASRSIPVCLEFSGRTEKIAVVTPLDGIRTSLSDLSDRRLVIESDDNNKLSIYLSNQAEARANNLEYFNRLLESALLENSNIREVLPELEIDDNVNLDTRQLSCWINKTSTIQKIADESFKNSVKDLLKSDPEFINSVKGERGPQGPPGRKGEDASPEEVAEELTTNSNKRYKISSAVKSLLNRDTQFKGEVRDLLKSDEGFRDSVKGDPGKNGESPPVDAVAQELITTKANELGQAILNVKHDDREILANNQVLQQGVAAQLMNDDNRNTLVTEVAKNEDLRKSVAGNQGLRDAVAINLKKDETFQTTVKGDPGKDGKSPSVDAVIAQLMNNDNRNTLVTEVAGNQDLQNAVAINLKKDETFQTTVKGDSGKDGESPPVDAIAQELITNKANELGQAVLEAKDDKGKEILVNSPILQEGIAEKLRENPGRTKGPKGEQGEPGPEGKPGKDGVQGPKGGKGDNNAQQNFALQKGEKLLDDVYEANIVLNDKTIAALPKIGYYMLNDQLVVHNHVTREKVVIPEEFHYLKVVRLGIGFGDSDYKLTFCNVLGNEFFEYKKYDPEYSRVPDEYKFISLSHAKKEYNPNLSELISHQPLFFIKKGPAEPGSDKYAAAVFELTPNGKGRKMATLIDEFGYFDQNGIFRHCDYHKGIEYHSDNLAEIEKKYKITDADSEFYLTEHDNVIIHTIPEL